MDFYQLQICLKELGINRGDILYVASDITLLLNEERKNVTIKSKDTYGEFLNKLVNLLQDLVGKEGTLMFPVFSWSFCKGVPFEYRKTKGATGMFSNWVMKERKDFIRTRHPMYSFMVWGKDAAYLKSFKNTDSWGADSPFAYLHKNKAKMLLLNVSTQRGLTFMHYVEQCMNVPYRYMKNFTSMYIEENGETSERTYSMYVRDLQTNPINDMPEEFLEINGVAQMAMVDKIRLKVIDLDKAYDVIANDILKNDAKNVMHY